MTEKKKRGKISPPLYQAESNKEKPLTKEGFLVALDKIIRAKKPDEKRSDEGKSKTSE